MITNKINRVITRLQEHDIYATCEVSQIRPPCVYIEPTTLNTISVSGNMTELEMSVNIIGKGHGTMQCLKSVETIYEALPSEFKIQEYDFTYLDLKNLSAEALPALQTTIRL